MMNEEEKRELAKVLAPHLAWDLSRSEIFTYEHSSTASSTAGMMFVEQIALLIRSKMYKEQSFTVAIIPSKPDGRLNP